MNNFKEKKIYEAKILNEVKKKNAERNMEE